MIKKVRSGVTKLSNSIALLSAELLLTFTIFFILLAILIIIIRAIFFNKEYQFDENVFTALKPYVSDFNTAAMQFFSIFGGADFLIPACLLLFFFLFFIYKNKWYFFKAVIIGVSNVLLMFGLKFFFNRPRPLIPLLKEVPGLSFPSGHAYMSLTFFGLIIYVIYRDVKNNWIKWPIIIILVVVIFLVGLSRVYLRVHYASDVIAGFCFGIVSFMLLLFMLKQIEKYNAKKLPAHLNVTKTEEDN